MEEEENASKEAFDATSFAEFFSRPGERQAGAVLLILGIPWNNSNGSKYGMNLGNGAQAPIGRIETDDTGMDLVELDSAR